MPTHCNPGQLELSCVERRRVVAAFDGGPVCSDGVALLLKQTDEAIGLIDRLRSDPVFGVLVVKLEEPLAGKRTLNRLELFAARGVRATPHPPRRGGDRVST